MEASGVASHEDSSSVERRQVLAQAYRVWYQHLISSYSQRLIIFQITLALSTLGLGQMIGILNKQFAVVWISCALLSMALHFFMLRQRGPVHAQICITGIILLGVLWSAVCLPGAAAHSALAALHVFFILVLAVFVGIPIQFAFCLFLTLCMLALILLLFGYSWPYCLALFLGGIGFLPGTTIISMQSQARFADRLLSHLPETISSLSVLDLLAWQTATVLGTSRAALCLRSGQSYTLKRIRVEPVAVEAAFCKRLHQILAGKPSAIGILPRRELDRQFAPVLQEWFGGRPQRLLFFVERVIHADSEEAAASLVPIPMLLAFLPLQKILLPFQTLTAVVRLWLNAARSRFFSSDMIFSTQKSVSERELELNELIHGVNNAAQDISIHADKARQLLPDLPGKTLTDLREELDQIDVALRELSTRVSDVKLTKELLLLKSLGKQEVLHLKGSLSEFADISRHLARNKGVAFVLKQDYSEYLGIKVASREFFETCLRQCLRLCISRIEEPKKIQVSAVEGERGVEFEFCASARPFSDLEIARMSKPGERELALDVAAIQALKRLLAMSDSELKIGRADQNWTFRFRFSLSKVAMQASQALTHEGWLLLVDDNPQVLTFYTRIAEALELKFRTAGSLAEARQILEQHGSPRLVISDIQLTDGLGLDLVVEIREKFGKEIPIIVVSGESDIALKVQEVGATRHLTKPVGRKRLFSELQALLK